MSAATAEKLKTEDLPTETTKGELATVSTASTAVSTDVYDFSQDAGTGTQDVGKDDLAIPFLVVLQPLSPQVNKKKGEYVEGAEPGMIFNTVTRELVDGEKGLLFLPALYARSFVEWIPRAKGGGFVADHGLAEGEKLAETGKVDDTTGALMLPNGNQIVDTRYWFGLILSEDYSSYSEVLITMSSSNIRPSKRLMTLVKGVKRPKVGGGFFNPAPAYAAYRLKTISQSNDKGDWFMFDVASDKPVTEMGSNGMALYGAGMAFAKLMEKAPRPVAADPTQASGGTDTQAASDNF